MNINGLLKEAEKNKSIPTQKRFSLEFSPPRKLPKTQVNPNAIRALIEKKERERRDERANLISKAVESTKRDEVNYKDRNGLRKAEQEHTEKCKKQWQKVQKDRRDFIDHMNKSADRKDKNKQARSTHEVISSIKSKEQEKERRKRKHEPYVGSTEPTKKQPKYTPTAAPKVTDIKELMRIAQKNAENKAFGTLVDPLRELEAKKPAVSEERLLTQAEKRKLAEQEAATKRRDVLSIPRIPKIGHSSESHKPNKHKKSDIDSRNESIKHSKDKAKDRSHTPSNGNHNSSGSNGGGGGATSSSRDKYEKPKDKRPSSGDKDRKHISDRDKPRTPHNGSLSSKTNANVVQPSPAARKPSSTGSNGNLGRPQNGNVAVQSMSSSAKEKLREEMAKKLAQLQRERLAEEERERQKRLQAKKARLAQEQHLKKKLQALQRGSAKMESDEEDEYEEDLDEYEDDFIDDGPIDDPYANGYSQHIKEIFKYDKSKFKNMEDDDIEESSFTRCMAEEARSARLGRQEDLEDMRKEAEENQKKSNRSKLKELAEKLKQKKKLTLCPV